MPEIKVPSLLSAAMSLRAADPTAWTLFVQGLEGRRADLTSQLVMAPPPMMQIAQGRAQEASTFHELMRDVAKTVDTINSRSKPENVRHSPAVPDPFRFT